jgi:cell division inhibitor SepF
MAGAVRKMAEYLGLVEVDESAYAATPASASAGASHMQGGTKNVARMRSGSAGGRHLTHGANALAEDYEEAEVIDGHFEMQIPESPIARITTVHPNSYNDARLIGEEYRVGTPVIMNLSELDDYDAKRIVDFSAGLVFGLHGTIERVTSKVFLLSPANVDVGAEARAQLEEDGFYNQS